MGFRDGFEFGIGFFLAALVFLILGSIIIFLILSCLTSIFGNIF